jgi:hypothetical protein
MSSVPIGLAASLRDELGLARAVETGTYLGDSAELLSDLFPEVVTIEVSPELHAEAQRRFSGKSGVTVLLGDSPSVLPGVLDPGVPTFFWLDGHWSGGTTGIGRAECPVLDELEAIGAGHPDDCIAIDDARMFAIAPAPPHDPAQWPSTAELFDALRSHNSGRHVTQVADLVVAVPERARPVLNRVAGDWRTNTGWDVGANSRVNGGGARERIRRALRRI